MTYLEYKKNVSKEINELPIKFAFSNEQFKSMMEEWGLTEKDTDKIYRLSDTGGFYLRKDAEIIRAFYTKPDKLSELMKDEKFAREAFEYEMDNHEYAINWQGDWDVCECFGTCKYAEEKDYTHYLTELGMEKLIPIYSEARKSHMKRAENW